MSATSKWESEAIYSKSFANVRSFASVLHFVLGSLSLIWLLGVPALLFVWPWSHRLYRIVLNHAQTCWVEMMAASFMSTKLVISGVCPQSVKGRCHILMVNHQLDVDWWYAWTLFLLTRDHGFVKIILKDSLKHVPVLGWGCWLYDFIFLRKSWGSDEAAILHKTKEFAKHNIPLCVLLFPEGTTVHKEAITKCRDFAAANNRPQLDRVLLPRHRALGACLKGLEELSPVVLDATMAYPGYSGEVPSYSMGYSREIDRDLPNAVKLLAGQGPSAIHIHITEHKSVPHHRQSQEGDEDEKDKGKDRGDSVDPLVKWLDERWAEKDTRLRHFAEHQRFPVAGDEKDEVQEVLTPRVTSLSAVPGACFVGMVVAACRLGVGGFLLASCVPLFCVVLYSLIVESLERDK